MMIHIASSTVRRRARSNSPAGVSVPKKSCRVYTIAPLMQVRPEGWSRLLSAGFDGYLSTPVNVAELLDTVMELCGATRP